MNWIFKRFTNYKSIDLWEKSIKEITCTQNYKSFNAETKEFLKSQPETMRFFEAYKRSPSIPIFYEITKNLSGDMIPSGDITEFCRRAIYTISAYLNYSLEAWKITPQPFLFNEIQVILQREKYEELDEIEGISDKLMERRDTDTIVIVPGLSQSFQILTSKNQKIDSKYIFLISSAIDKMCIEYMYTSYYESTGNTELARRNALSVFNETLKICKAVPYYCAYQRFVQLDEINDLSSQKEVLEKNTVDFYMKMFLLKKWFPHCDVDDDSIPN